MKNKNIPIHNITNIIGEMYGERAIQAHFRSIMCKRNEVEDFARTMIGGVILAPMCTSETWERWEGTVIIIPKKIEMTRSENGSTLESMMMNWLGHTDDVDDEEPFWKEVWKTR